MKGSVDDPNFGINSLIQLIARKAAAVQVRRYALTFVPYADVVSIAMKAGEMALRVRFEDLIYLPAQIALEENQQAYMQQFIALMNDKPKLQVQVCGFGVAADLKNRDGSENLTDNQTKRLRAIAQKRSEEFKNYAIKKGKIESSRILLCNPQLDFEEGAKPRIEIDI